VSILFKLKKRTSASAREQVTRTLERLNASVRPLSQADEPGALAGVFAADVSPASDESKVVDELSKIPAVEYAELKPKRRLMLP
jgi:hypothetical protein